MSTASRRIPAANPRTPLTREAVAAAALDLVDREGLAALSMRRLAQELGVGTMTLYGHVRGKEDLLDAVVDATAARHGVPVVAGGSWREQLTAIAHELHRALVLHPALVQLRLRRPLISPGALRLTEVGLRALRDAGLTAEDAASSFRVLFLYTFSFAAFSSPELSEAQRRESRAALAVLPAEEYPTVVATGDALIETMGGEAQFEFGLERVLDGIAALVG